MSPRIAASSSPEVRPVFAVDLEHKEARTRVGDGDRRGITREIALVGVVGRVVGRDHAAVGRDDLGPALDVLAELLVDRVVVDPRRDRLVARSEGDTADVLTAGVSVLVIGTGTPAFAAIDSVLAAAVLPDHGEHVAALVEHGHVLGEGPGVAVVEVDATVGFLGSRCVD